MSLEFKKSCRYTLSANEIRQFSECARKRYYSSRDCLAIRSNRPANALVLGSAFHEALQYYYTKLNEAINQCMEYDHTVLEPSKIASLLDSIEPFELYRPKVNEETGEALIDEETGEVIMEPVVRPEDVKTLECMIENYKPQIADDLFDYEVIGCEVNFNLENWPIDDVQYHGLIDMVVRNREDNKIYFFEHKTCTNFRPEIYSRFDIQLHIYAVYGEMTYGEDFGGMILNQVKKAKTVRGYDQQRDTYIYDKDELDSFVVWLKAKTMALVSPENNHAPCNNYMSCKMCEYMDICMKYGYNYPKSHEEVTTVDAFDDGLGNAMFKYDPRDGEDGGED